jgi:hypothetical protein
MKLIVRYVFCAILSLACMALKASEEAHILFFSYLSPIFLQSRFLSGFSG